MQSTRLDVPMRYDVISIHYPRTKVIYNINILYKDITYCSIMIDDIDMYFDVDICRLKGFCVERAMDGVGFCRSSISYLQPC